MSVLTDLLQAAAPGQVALLNFHREWRCGRFADRATLGRVVGEVEKRLAAASGKGRHLMAEDAINCLIGIADVQISASPKPFWSTLSPAPDGEVVRVVADRDVIDHLLKPSEVTRVGIGADPNIADDAYFDVLDRCGEKGQEGRFQSGARVRGGRPFSWITRAAALSGKPAPRAPGAADIARDFLGLCHIDAGDVLLLMAFGNGIMGSAAAGGPSFIEAGAHIRYRASPLADSTDGWGCTVDLADLCLGNRGDGAPECLLAEVPASPEIGWKVLGRTGSDADVGDHDTFLATLHDAASLGAALSEAAAEIDAMIKHSS